MDMAALIVILTPILLPVVEPLGVDPVQFGIILLLNLGIGLCTPPVGSTLFVGCADRRNLARRGLSGADAVLPRNARRSSARHLHSGALAMASRSRRFLALAAAAAGNTAHCWLRNGHSIRTGVAGCCRTST